MINLKINLTGIGFCRLRNRQESNSMIDSVLNKNPKLGMIRQTAFYVIIALTLIVAGCKAKPLNEKLSNQYYHRAIKAYHHGEYAEAVKYFEKAIVFNPHKADPYLAAGEIYEDYLNQKSKARERYLKYLDLSDNEELRAMVLSWLGQDQPADTADTQSISPTANLKRHIEKLEDEKSKLQTQLAVTAEQNATLNAKLNKETRRSILTRLGSGLMVIVPVALLVLTVLSLIVLVPRLRKTATISTGSSGQKTMHDISTKYYWIEDGAKIGMVLFATTPGGEVEVAMYDESGVKKSYGSGKIHRGILDLKLEDGKGYEATARFEFHDRGRTFTAAWRDKWGAGMATGIRERIRVEHELQNPK